MQFYEYRRRSRIRTQASKIGTHALMLYLWNKKWVFQKHALSLRPCSRQWRAPLHKSNNISLFIWEINCLKTLCMQQNLNSFMENYSFEKKVANIFSIWTSHLGSAYKEHVSMHCPSRWVSVFSKQRPYSWPTAVFRQFLQLKLQKTINFVRNFELEQNWVWVNQKFPLS